MKTICVLGLGYIGLPTASILATKGFSVIGVDTKQQVIDTIKKGNIHIVEPDLDILVKSAVHSGNLTTSLKPQEADVFIIAVPTPFKEDRKPDLTYVAAAVESIIPVLKKENLVILESTSPVGTTESAVASLIAEHKQWKAGEDFFVAHCPERVLPGRILKELVDNDRIIGGINRASAEAARDLYSSFVSGNIFLTDCTTAELVKLVENAYRDVNIAFANELSLICDHLGLRVWEVIELANKHPRVNILRPGPGVGGHCIAVDPWFIVDAAPEQSRLIRTARVVNDSKPHFVVEKVKKQARKFKAPVIGCLGLSYKNDVDDLRESPALEITRNLIKENIGTVLACEPFGKTFDEFPLHPLEKVLKDSDIIVLLVNHKQFYDVDRELLKEKIVIDTLGVWR
ncbi:MAG TPA: UDP-N-acetyl-D-mannosamine dehydrogenase [Nitrospirota bacterium]|nr:UDP-N-acetyl-D-mannosamine dehydrogenase [Nitrospirota bacterium]